MLICEYKGPKNFETEFTESEKIEFNKLIPFVLMNTCIKNITVDTIDEREFTVSMVNINHGMKITMSIAH